MEMFKGVFSGGVHHKKGKNGAKNARFSIDACTVLRAPLTHSDPRLVRF